MKKKIICVIALLACLAIGLISPRMAARASDAEQPVAYVLKVDGIIGPATYDLIKRHLKSAANNNADIVVLEMHTPGGLYDSMQQIIQSILSSPVPVVTYVSPPGSHAASAGTYILYASHIAAMAPGTNIGAATPIQMGNENNSGKDDKSDPSLPGNLRAKPETTLEHKMVNDAAAYIKTLAELRGRNLEWAEKAVREAETLTASEALSKKVIDVIAQGVPELLQKIDGKTVKMNHGETRTLKTKGARIEHSEADWRTQILEVITHPNITFLLTTLGSYGLIYEFSHPGVFFPGVIGAICLLFALLAMNVLPIDYTGLSLICLGVALMAGEAFVPSFGALGIGGALAFAVGGVMLIDSDTPGFGVDLWLIGCVTLFSLVILSLLLTLVFRTQKKPSTTGAEELLSATGEVIRWSQGQGTIQVTGEIWSASASGDYILKKGDKVTILKVDGLHLTVTPASAASSSAKGT